MELREGECGGRGDQAVEGECPFLGDDGGDTAVITHEVEWVGSDGFSGDEPFGWFAVVGKLEEMEHVFVFFLEDNLPGLFGHVEDGAGDGFVPEFPADAFEDGIGAGDGTELEFRWRWEVVGGHDFVGECFLVIVAFPFDVAGRVSVGWEEGRTGLVVPMPSFFLFFDSTSSTVFGTDEAEVSGTGTGADSVVGAATCAG